MEKEVSSDGYSRLTKVLIFFSVALLIVFILIIVYPSYSCGDETSDGSCSSIKPYFCEKGVLVERSSTCGCPDDFEVAGFSCVSEYHKNPKGVSLEYLINGEIKEIDFVVYEGFYEHSKKIPRFVSNENFSLEESRRKIIENEKQAKMIFPLVVEIKNLASDKNDQAKIAISLVQLIQYNLSNSNASILKQAASVRYPYEVLYEGQAICGEKSLLLAFLLKEIGYGVSLLYFPEDSHEAVGIKCSEKIDYKDTGYCFIETTGLVGENGDAYIGVTFEFSTPPEVIIISEGDSIGTKL